jgi:hypothetical protein
MVELTQKLAPTVRPGAAGALRRQRSIPARWKWAYLFWLLAVLLFMLPFHAELILKINPDAAAYAQTAAMLETDPDLKQRLNGYGNYFTQLSQRLPFDHPAEMGTFSLEYAAQFGGWDTVTLIGMQSPPESFMTFTSNAIAAQNEDFEATIQRAAQATVTTAWLQNLEAIPRLAPADRENLDLSLAATTQALDELAFHLRRYAGTVGADQLYNLQQSLDGAQLPPEMQRSLANDIPLVQSHCQRLANLLERDAQQLQRIRLEYQRAAELNRLWRYGNLAEASTLALHYRAILWVLSGILALFGAAVIITANILRQSPGREITGNTLKQRLSVQAAPPSPTRENQVKRPGSRARPTAQLSGIDLDGKRIVIPLITDLAFKVGDTPGEHRTIFLVKRQRDVHYIYTHSFREIVKINHQIVIGPTRLKNGDLIRAGGQFLVFEVLDPASG